MAKNMINRRTTLKTLGSASIGLTAGCLGLGGEDEWPNDSTRITIINGFSAGGTFGFFSRQFAQYLPKYLPNDPTVTAQHMPGSGGLVAYNHTWNADPDGETLMIRHGTNSAIYQIARSDDVEYNVTEFTDLMTPYIGYWALAGHADLDIGSWEDLADVATDLTWGSNGVGSVGHMTGVFLGAKTGAWEPDALQFVHGEGTSANLTAMDSGDLDVTSGVPATILEYAEELDSVEGLFTFSPPGEIDFPWPTAEEFGVPSAEALISIVNQPFIVCGPPDMSEERADILEQAFLDAARDNDLVVATQETGRRLSPRDAETSAQLQQDKLEQFRQEEELLNEILE